jgi:serine phosphatase RsbU (regulator of sigma subunit)/PAS domain-containing protein
LIKPISAYLVFVCFFIIWTSLHVILRGYRPARYFILGVSVLGMYEVVFTLVRFGFIPANTSLEQIYVVAIMLQMLLFSLTLLDRINLLKAKTEEAHRQLQENEQRMTQFLEAMPIGVIVQDRQEVTKFINHHARQIFDLPHYSAQLPNINSTTVQFISSNSGKPYPLEQLPYQRALQGEWVFADDLEVVFVGKSIPLEIWSSPIFDEQGTILYAISAFQDTVERRKAERERLVLSAIQQELSIAQMIQESLLPIAYPNWPKLNVVCYGQPAKEVGGSFYDYYAFPPTESEQKYAFAIGDVTGRGIPAALLMAVSIALLRAVVTQVALPPSLLLSLLDEMLEHYTQRSKMNCALCYVELTVSATGETVAKVANGDLIPPIIKRRSGQVELLEVAGPPLGAGLGKLLGFSERSTTLAPGDFLILLNDGVVRAWNTQGEEMPGFERALAMVKAGPSDSADSLIFHLKQETLYLMVGNKQDDDLTIIIVQV